MRRVLIALIIFIFSVLSAKAAIISDTIFALTPNNLDYTRIKNNHYIQLIIIKLSENSLSDIGLAEGDTIDVKVLEYVKPKRGKRNGYYKIEYKMNSGVVFNGKMRASEPKDMQNIAEKAGVIIVGHILKIPGFSQAIAVSKGLISPNESENRLQSAGRNLYESTPLTYIEKGKNFVVDSDGIVVLKLKSENIEYKQK